MLKAVAAFSGFTVNNLAEAKQYYINTLGLKLIDESMGLRLGLPQGAEVFIYEKPDHQPADFTILNFVVSDIDAAITTLQSAGVTFERYDNLPATQDDKGVLRGRAAGYGPDIAWFKDPAGNTLSILQPA